MYIKFPIIPIFGNNAFDYIAAVRYDREQELHNVVFLCQFYYGMQIWYGYAMIVNFQKSVVNPGENGHELLLPDFDLHRWPFLHQHCLTITEKNQKFQNELFVPPTDF